MRVMIVGPMHGQIAAASKIALTRGAKVSHVDSIDQATVALCSGRGADLLLVDSDLDIRALIAANLRERIIAPVVACGIDVEPEAAARAIAAGAIEFIPLPPDAELIGAILASLADESHEVVAVDPAMRRILELAEQIARSDASILVTGESGVGKEIVARHIHAKSKRARAPFIAINCAAIPENLLESELFGHERGAFTGANARRIGKFEEAQGGTLLLDEISEMDLRLQAKLLRAIQERVIDRVGGAKPVPIDIRILATSNRDLQSCVRDGLFREDLLYRLNVFHLRVPPLRERPADITALSRHFVAKYAAANGRGDMVLSPEALAHIASLRWAGNVRELENAMHRAVLLCESQTITAGGIATPEGLPVRGAQDALTATSSALARHLVGRSVAAVEQDLILETLTHVHGNRTHAASILGISIRTLRNKLKQYGDEGVPIPPPAVGSAA